MGLDELYTEVITEYGRSKKHRHGLEHPTVEQRGVNPSCGDDIHLELTVEDGVIVAVGFTGAGCAISEASTAIMAELIEGKAVGEALDLLRRFVGMIQKTVTDEAELEPLEDGIALRGIANMPARVKCAVLPWRTLDQAIKKLEHERA